MDRTRSRPHSFHRILVIGTSGAGKTTLSNELGRLLYLPVIHLDRVFWKPGWTPTPRPEFIRKLRPLLARPCWIIDGNYGGTLLLRLKHADMVVFMDFPRWRSMVNILKRIWKYYGRTRPDVAAGCPERFDLEFFRWVWGFHISVRPRILEALASLRRGKVLLVDLKDARAVDRFLDQLKRERKEAL